MQALLPRPVPWQLGIINLFAKFSSKYSFTFWSLNSGILYNGQFPRLLAGDSNSIL